MSASPEDRGRRITLDRVEELFVGDEPNWDAITIELLCPRCGYNVRQLPAPRCPECGLAFDWRLLITRSVDRADIVFEHAWRRRPVRSWLTTFGWTFRPWVLWRKVGLYDEICVKPLLLFLFTSVPAVLAAAHVAACAAVQIAYMVTPAVRGGWRLWAWQHPELHQLWMFGTWPFLRDPRYVLVLLGIVLGLAGAGLVLFALQQTLGRCRVRSIQLLRVIAYVAPPLVALSLAVILTFVVLLPRGMFVGRIPLIPNDNYFDKAPIWHWCVLGGGVFAILSGYAVLLRSALRRYLKLPRAGLVAVLSSLVAGLFAYTILVRLGLEVFAK
mgnify:FL=1